MSKGSSGDGPFWHIFLQLYLVDMIAFLKIKYNKRKADYVNLLITYFIFDKMTIVNIVLGKGNHKQKNKKKQRREKMKKDEKAVTLIALVITIIVLLILAAISIAMLTGENGILKKAANAKEETQIKAYQEKIELIRNELRLQKENYEPPTMIEMKKEFDNNQKDWVATTEIKQIDNTEILELKTKEGYIFHITETGSEYKGKGDLPTETTELAVTAKDTDTSQIVRKKQMLLADLFEITWGNDGIGTVEYSVTGNLNFQNKTFASTDISNLSELEIGNYIVTCKVTSPQNKIVTATKENVKVIQLASTTITNANNNEIEANAIYSEYDLAYFRDLVNGGQSNINAKVMNDIPLNIVSATENGGWLPIGYFDGVSHWTGPYFAGTFDGNEHTITISSIANMTSTSKHREGGLFGMIIGGRVEKLTIDGNISSNASSGVAGVVGDIKEGTIYKCMNHATIVGSSDNGCGGIAGTSTNSIIQECTNHGSINGKSFVGGIVGLTYESSEIKNCINQVNVKCKEAVAINFYGSSYNMCFGGGIVGQAKEQSKIESCTNEGKIMPNSEPINATYVCLGGIAGEIEDSCTISKSNNKGEVSYRVNDNGLIGGITGYSVNQSIVEQCYNIGTIVGRLDSSRGASAAGGIIGWNDGSTIKNCYNTATVEGNTQVGGLAGGTDGRCSSKRGYIYNCYSANTSIIGNTYVGTFMGSLKEVEIKNCCFITDTTYNGRELNDIIWTSWKFLSIEEMKTENSGLLTMLNSDEVQWKQEKNKNNGLPYLMNNIP